jgi:sugar (pentulose or hexulose) kinase
MTRLVLGIDVGTTATKAALFDLERPARPLAVARRASVVHEPRPGYSEADPRGVLALVGACVREVVGAVAPGSIGAIGVSGTACGAWLVADGQPVRPAILWNDGRAAAIVDAWRAEGRMAEIFEISGNVPFPGYTLPVLNWLARHEPENLAAATRCLCCKDWIRGWLTGVWGSDESDASYVPFDIRARRRSDRLLELTDTSAAAALLPELFDVARTDPLRADIAAQLGLPAGIPVALGATDIVAGCVGAGAVASGHAVTILGTSANSSIVTAEPEFEPREIGIMAAAPLGRWVRTMVNTSGTMTLDWAAQMFTGGDVGAMFALAETADLSDVPVLLPYLAGAGVVSPFVDAHARGAFLGLRASHGRAELCRAVVEGLAFAVADCYACMPSRVTRITATGGAARSDMLLQAIADASGALTIRPAGEEFGARGAALLAGLHAGLVPAAAFEDLAAVIEVGRAFAPTPERLATRLARYRQASDITRATGRLWL